MKTIIISISFVLLSLVSFSQAPGYMGKKWSVNYSASGLLRNFTFNPLFELSKTANFSPVHSANVSYTSSKKLMWSFEYMMTDFTIEDYYTREYLFDIIAIETNYGISLKIFKDSWIAPVGHYHKIGFYRTSYTGLIVSGDYLDSKTIYSNKFVYGRGLNFVLADRILFNIGAEIHFDRKLIFNYNNIYLDYNYNGRSERISTDDYFILSEVLLINVGIGILI